MLTVEELVDRIVGFNVVGPWLGGVVKGPKFAGMFDVIGEEVGLIVDGLAVVGIEDVGGSKVLVGEMVGLFVMVV